MDEFSELEKQTAQKLYASYSRSLEQQGIIFPGSNWRTLASHFKHAWLRTARDFLQSLTGK